MANFATPREGSAAPYRFLFHAQASSGAHVLVQVSNGYGWRGASALWQTQLVHGAEQR